MLCLHPAGLLLSLVLGGPHAAFPEFHDVTARSGVDFVHTGGSRAKDFIVEVNGSGVVLFDADGDGDLDLYFANGSLLDLPAGEPPPRDALYRNQGGLRFSDVTRAAGLGDAGWSCGAAAADVDNDGDQDLFVANLGPDVLYLNRGDGTFEERQGSGAEDPRWGASASFGDVDGDGLVDLYVANYLEFDRARVRRKGEGQSCTYKGFPVFCGPGGLPPARDGFYLNLGGGRFREAGAEWGLDGVAPAYALGVLFVDVNRDRRPDIFVANDTMANVLLLNQGGKRFLDAGLYLGLAYNEYGTPQASMGVAAGDARGAGREDIFITNYEDDTNTYHRAEEDGFFTDATWASGLGEPSYKRLGWGTFFFDADLDGRLDLFVANGHLMPEADRMRSSPGYRQTCQLFRGDGTGRFEELSGRAGPGLAVRRSFRGA
ncbi:MAG: FG-GAP repeat domain-containing protein, partial [Thermoanaerobaculia bacterium]